MARYREKYPDVVLDLRFTNRKVDLAAEGYDLALRVTRDHSPQLIARRICGIRFYLVAAPHYLSAGVPRPIADRADFQGIGLGRASCRARVCQSVEFSGSADTLKN